MGKSALLERWEFWNFVSPCENRERTVRCSAGSHHAAQLNECKADNSLSVSQIIYKFTVFTHPACLSTIKHQAFNTFPINSDDRETKTKWEISTTSWIQLRSVHQIQQDSRHQFFNCWIVAASYISLHYNSCLKQEKFAFYALQHSMYIATQSFRYFLNTNLRENPEARYTLLHGFSSICFYFVFLP